MVRDVEELATELKAEAFRDREHLIHSDVSLCEFRSAESVAAQVAQGAFAGGVVNV